MTERKRKTKYTEDEKAILSEKALELIRHGPAESLTQACKACGLSAGQFLTWVEKDNGDLKERYARARVALLDRMAEGLIDISDANPAILPTGAVDSGYIAHQKLKIDTRKWLLSKLAPKKYGDKIEVSGDAENPIAIQKIERVVVKHDK